MNKNVSLNTGTSAKNFFQIPLVLFQALAIAPITIYPGLFVAGIMGLAGESGNTPAWQMMLVNWFLTGTIIYPIPAICFLIWGHKKFKRGRFRSALLITIFPLLITITPILLLLSWSIFSLYFG